MQAQEATAYVCELPIEVRPEHIDVLGHVNNVTYVQWMQDVAVSHWLSAATEAERAETLWVALRHEIDYLKSGLLGDALVARTWVGEAKGVRFERFTEVVRPNDGRCLVRARSEWLALSAESLRPRRLTPELCEIFYRTPEALVAPAEAHRSTDGAGPLSRSK